MTENGGARKYQLYITSTLAYMADVSSVMISADIDVALANNAASLTPLVDGQMYTIGNRFEFTANKWGNTNKQWFKLSVDGDGDLTIFMQGQQQYTGGHLASGNRQRMHYVQISIPSSLKCFVCGLCGDFKRKNTGSTWQQNEGCDGSLVSYNALSVYYIV